MEFRVASVATYLSSRDTGAASLGPPLAQIPVRKSLSVTVGYDFTRFGPLLRLRWDRLTPALASSFDHDLRWCSNHDLYW